MSKRARLTRGQIAVIKHLARHGGPRPISLATSLRLVALSLWRRELIEIWYRQMGGMEPALRGPFYALTLAGLKLAGTFFDDP